MHKTAIKILLLFACFSVSISMPAFAQTITIGTVDPGPYGPGSTIAIPFHIDDSGGCMPPTGNTFQLFMSNQFGVFTSAIPVATLTNTFYATFINYIIPTGLPAGTNYQFKVQATSPAISTGPTTGIIINTSTGIAAAIDGQHINQTFPEVFGACSNTSPSYAFTNTTITATTVTASFLNESSQAVEALNQNIINGYTFNAATTNYTITVKATNAAGVIGTYAYQLINNQINTTIGTTGKASVCLQSGIANLTKNIDITSATGIESNYPGNTYTFSWGDGSTSDVLTLCQIKKLNGLVTHGYTRVSCGNAALGQANSFEVDFSANSPYCGRIGTSTSSPAQIVIAPTNNISNPPAIACANTPVTFVNASISGPDPNSATNSCAENPNAVFAWVVDGNIVSQNYPVNKNFVYTFTSNGTHKVTLRAQTNNGACSASDYSINICIQNPPTPSFTLPASPYCESSGPVTPTNTSVVDNTCNPDTYTWTVNPNTFTYANGTNANSQTPQFNFISPGSYTIKLAISTASCGTITAPTQTIVVTAPPVAQLSSDFSICGSNRTYTFDATAGSPTQTTFTGTTQQLPTTYTWVVTGVGAYQFVGGTTLNSKYPQILFSDFATYTIMVTHQNSCGSVSATQQIAFLQAPNVSAGSPQTVCQGSPVSLTGTITGGIYNTSLWTSPTGGAFSTPGSLATNYTPTNADIAAGSVTLTLQANTSLAQCSVITDKVTITLIPTDVIISTAANSVCTGQPVNYTIIAKNPNSTFTWTSVLTSGTATGFTPSGNTNKINDIITNSDPTTSAVITYTITPQSNGCTGTPFTFTVTVPSNTIVTPTVPNPAICSNLPANIGLSSSLAGTKYTWTASASASVTGFNNVTTPTSNATIPDVLVNNGIVTATVTYTITPYNSAGCPGASVTAQIKVYPVPVTANAGSDDAVCDATVYTLQGNSPGSGTGLWTVISGSGLTFADNTSPTTTVSGLQPGSVYTLQWAITSGPGCQTTARVVLTVNVPTVGGTTSTTAPSPVCAGSNSGQITLTGQLGTILRWESSTDNGVTWHIIANTTNSLTYLNITQTTQYHAVIQNGSCLVKTSGITTIVINPTAPIADAGSGQTLCGVTTVTLNGNNPGTFPGVWRQTAGLPVTFADSTNYRTAVTGLVGGTSYTFEWTIAGLAPCPSTHSQVIINDNADVTPSFTTIPKSGCGNLSVQFTNTSNGQAGASFVWSFGDGSAQSTAISPTHIFPQRTDGTDTTYIVSLSVTNNCLQRAPFIDSVKVRPALPVARILPAVLSGCGNFSLTVQNISPGTSLMYDFYLYDGATLVQKITRTDKTDAVFNPITTATRKSFTLYMIATGFCNNTTETTHIPITISPVTVTAQMFVQNNINSGCAPLNLTFFNNSAGGDNFNYNIYDRNNKIIDQPISGTDPLPYRLDSVGTYYVSITASNACGANESPKIRLDVYAVPTPDFATDTIKGCKDAKVQFINKTVSNDPNTPVTSLIYDWNFGDGSPHSSSYTPPPHAYHFVNSPYTVTLTATNATSGCNKVIVKRSFINIIGAPGTDFTEKPDSITSIPNYSFSFTDQTTGNPVSWFWTFGQGLSAQVSTKQNPSITFPDTGLFRVSLTTTNSFGCDSTTVHHVQITGVPGQLFLPNAFVPTSVTPYLRVFMAKGSGILKWHLQIFNKYGQVVWETTRLDSKGAPIDGWDGTFKGVPAPQGVYVWQASATFINGNEWKGNSYNNSTPKQTGSVHLIR
jgi:PKD repeat protein